MAGNDTAKAVTKLSNVATALSGPAMEKRLTQVGLGAKRDGDAAVTAELGDNSMSNWPRGRPIAIRVRFESSASKLEVTPAPRSRGPWRVLEDGRKPGGSFDLIQVGRRRKDGTRRGKTRGRNQGATPAKRTWTKATIVMGKNAGKKAGRLTVDDVRKAWQRGG